MVLSLDRWIGKVAVVTGASAGIGAEILKKLAESGIIAVGLARRAEKIQEFSKKCSNLKGKIHAIRCDVTNETDVKKAFEEIKKIGAVHILINNAGTMGKTNLYDGQCEEWRRILETNVMGPCIVAKEAIRVMSEQKIAGQIININSILGHHVYNIPKANIYPASKHALTALTETLRLELIGIDSDIKVTSLSPGPVDDTEFFVRSNIGKDGDGPIKHFLKPEDIVDSVMYVLSTPPHLHVAELMLRPLKEPL
ncbi:farnesol dehydrogenase-like [Sitophilus oryzae]|uniref:Farnesol dehydrogenase-like n=1 Tax=Sitophilus oryzae TaxID=7048 RepID=A0A6J2YNC9_SITOR|nr:farnesol dehydrogenase-like [Sitophilus oryzae]